MIGILALFPVGAYPEEHDDGELVRRARKGGAEGGSAFSELVSRHEGAIVRLLRHLLGSLSDAEDVAQEVFVRAYKAIESVPDADTVRPWLRVVATRLAFNYKRDRKTRRRYHDQAPLPEGVPFRPAERAHLERSLEDLSYPYREILVLRYIEELQVKEIAGLLGLGESAARMRLMRAREAFGAVYEKLLATPTKEESA